MKKLLLAFSILGFVACGGEKTEETPAPNEQGGTVNQDSLAKVQADSLAKVQADSLAAEEAKKQAETKAPASKDKDAKGTK